MAVSGIQGQLLEITVVGCSKLRDTEWISRQDPYVCLEYASSKFRTRTCTDGGKNPIFQEKFVFTLIEGLREINVVVWNSNTISYDDFIGSGKIQLQKVLLTGFDDSSWPIQTKNGRHAGEVRLIMHYSNANKPMTSHAPSAPPYGVSHVSHSQNSPYGYAPPPPSAYPQYAFAPPPPQAYPYHSQPPPFHPQSAYPPPSQGAYPPPPSTYPPPPSTYPPPPSPYPPPPQWAPNYPPPGPYGMYPPPPY
ncbi:unnamed protein product [Rhodiola kirilowii]